MRLSPCLLALTVCAPSPSHAAEQRVSSPDGTISVIVNDAGGLHYRIEIDGKPLVQESPLGLEFQEGVALGPSAVIRKADTTKNDGSREDRFGNRRVVPDRHSELALTLASSSASR
jgi:alpha-glucosidase